MKKLFTSIFAISITLMSFAQKPDKALARVSYSFSHIIDTTQKDRPYTENMVLLIGKNASQYVSYDKVNQIIDGRKEAERLKNNPNGIRTIRGFKPTSPIEYFYFVDEQKFFTKELLINNYLVEDEVPKINWKITKDTANFSGMSCKKAQAHFKGRNWTVWFAPSMPFQSGPWKLNGLPGLIIEAVDETKTVKFSFAGIETTTRPDDNLTAYLGNEIKLPTNVIKATRKDLDKLKEANEKDPQGFMKTQMGGGNVVVVGGISLNGSSGGASSGPPQLILNNPIELPEF